MIAKYVGNFRICKSKVEHDFFGFKPAFIETKELGPKKRQILCVKWIEGGEIKEFSIRGLWLVYMDEITKTISVDRHGDSYSELPILEKSMMSIGKLVGTFSLGRMCNHDFYGLIPAITQSIMTRDGACLRVVWFEGGPTIEYSRPGKWGVYLDEEKRISIMHQGPEPATQDSIQSTGSLDLRNPEHMAILMMTEY